MASRKTAPTVKRSVPVRSDDSSVTGIVAISAVTLVAGLLLGGYWMQKQQSDLVQQMRQAQVYENYRDYTRPAPKAEVAPALPAAFVQAQQNREKLLNHPAVTPGAGFNKPGVQSTGVAIIDAIDQAKSSN